MGFLSTVYLWLLPLLTLPLLIHLFFNRNFKTIHFSSIKFLKILKVDSFRKVRLLEMLLLLIRTLIILSIILMLSKPVIKSETFSALSSSQDLLCVIALDDSFSITKSSTPPTLREFYSAKIKKILDTLPEKARLKIVTTSDTLSAYDGIKEDFLLSDLRGKMKSSSSQNNLLSLYLKKLNFSYAKELHFLTDMQVGSIIGLEKNKLNRGWNIFIHKIPPPDNNLALLSIEINEELIALNEEFEVLVQIQNNGIEAAKNALILLSINNINIGQKQLDLLPGEIKEEKFRTIINTNGEHIGAFEIIHDNYKNSLSYIFFWWWQ